ncbi:hypothetical protein B0H16DRAFT_1553159 [Mycena metata]|uniref:F-box domain-containing protein n=1 Tax=Mycena metata TaxID=1033252 RepID=A0AAD7ITL4_9AGAR|nr:hypothetical protein B0H16DRAFT_1553159 [Mycena metata]
MVSADNVNLDVLELVFSFLAGNDLASVALVSRSFCAGVIPRLYATLLFRLSHAKRYPTVMSPFAAVAAHPEFAIHVRHVDIRQVPVIKEKCNPKFLLECTRALGLCHNITSFRYFASWNLMNLLPKWTATLKANLTTLTLFMANDLNETVLGSALEELPNLVGLHVIGCSKVDHIAMLHLVSHTPYLESLSMTTSETNRPFPDPPASLSGLRHLALDARLGAPEAGHLNSASVLSSILRHVSSSSPRLLSFIVKYPDRQMALTTAFIGKLISAHATTLKNLSFLDCLIGTTDSLSALCAKCTALERLEVMIPVRDITFFSHSLARSTTVRTLIDVEMHTHSPRPQLAQHEVRQLFTRVPSLQKIVSDKRIWTRRTDPDGQLLIGLERRPRHTAAIHWFMPRDI